MGKQHIGINALAKHGNVKSRGKIETKDTIGHQMMGPRRRLRGARILRG
jgi:hypothetical protein